MTKYVEKGEKKTSLHDTLKKLVHEREICQSAFGLTKFVNGEKCIYMIIN